MIAEEGGEIDPCFVLAEVPEREPAEILPVPPKLFGRDIGEIGLARDQVRINEFLAQRAVEPWLLEEHLA
jgi:hypothetical protein